ncbi:hypothetical protein H0H93_009471, partial [Arthromyces matolae]
IDESPSESTAVDVPLEAIVDVDLAQVDSITPFANPHPHPLDNEVLDESPSPVADLTLALEATLDVDTVVLVASPPLPDENQVDSDNSIAELWTLHPHPPEQCGASTLDVVALPVSVAIDVDQQALPASLSLPLRPVCEDHEVDFDVDDMVSRDGAVDGLVAAQLGLSVATVTTMEPDGDGDDDDDDDHGSTPLEGSLNSDHDHNHDLKDEDEDKNDDDDDADADDDVKLTLGIPVLGDDDNGGLFHVEAFVETADVQAIDMDTVVVSAVQTTQPALSSDEVEEDDKDNHDGSELAQALLVALPDDSDDVLAAALHVPLPMDLEGDFLLEGDGNEKLGVVGLRMVARDECVDDVRRTEGDDADDDDDDPCELGLSVIRPCTPLPGGTEGDNGDVLKGHGDDLALRIPLPEDEADEDADYDTYEDSSVHVTSYPDSLPRKADVEGDDNDENMLFHTHVWRSVEELGQHAIGIGKQQLGPSRSRVLDLRLAMGSSPPPLPPPPQGIIARPLFLPPRLFQPPTGMAVSSSSSRPPLPLQAPLSFDPSYSPRPRPGCGSGAGQHTKRGDDRIVLFNWPTNTAPAQSIIDSYDEHFGTVSPCITDPPDL